MLDLVLTMPVQFPAPPTFALDQVGEQGKN